jgi:protein involved in polysaccharide export with SLBB domain
LALISGGRETSFMRKHIYILFLLLIGFQCVEAQVRKTTQMSALSGMNETQLFQLWRNASKMGLTEAEILKMFTEMGLNGSQYLQMKKRFEKKVEETSEADLQEEEENLNEMETDTSFLKSVPTRRKSNVFGIQFFSNAKNTFSPGIKLATPANYILGPDDQLQLILTGMNESVQLLKINADGFINIKYAGIVQIAGLTIEKAEQLIKRKMSGFYPYIANGKTTLTVVLNRYRTIRVAVMGEAYRPGNYQVPGVASLFNVLYLTGGPSEKGSLRNIQIIRAGKKITELDFYQFLLHGAMQENFRFQDQDVIYFPFYNKHVSMYGAVKRPSVYELKDNESLKDLFLIAGGFSENAYQQRLKIYQVGSLQRSIKDLPVSEMNTYLPQNGDSVLVDALNDTYSNKLNIQGAVRVAGDYELTKGLTLKGLIEKAGGVKENAYLNRGYINRLDDQMQKQLIGFDLIEMNKTKELDILLQKNDSVYIPFVDNMKQQQYIQLEGAVKNPGYYEFRKGMLLEDALLIAGGLALDADYRKVEVLRQYKGIVDSLQDKMLNSYMLSVDPSLKKSSKEFFLEEKDKIVVTKILNTESIGTVKVGGEVLHAGNYFLNSRSETAAEVIDRAGGLTPFGNIAQVKIYRNGILVGIDLQEEKYRLNANDSIVVPKMEPLVEVDGAVYNHQFVQYESPNLRYYISSSGGLTDKALLKKAYVQYSNGLNKKTRRFLFFRSYPTIKPGSKIIVPSGDGVMNKLITSNNISAVLSSITALVSLIVLLKK